MGKKNSTQKVDGDPVLVDTPNTTTKEQELVDHYEKNGLVTGFSMDKANAQAAVVLLTKGETAAVNFMFTRPDGSTRSYAEMRSMYG